MQISQNLLYEYQLLLLGRIPSIQPDLFDGEAKHIAVSNRFFNHILMDARF